MNNDAAPVSRQRGPFLCVSPLVLAVHGEEAQHHQVEEGSDDSQPHQDVHKAESYIQRLFLQSPVLLQRHEIAKSDGGERDEAVIVRLEEAPVLVVREGGGADAQRSHAGEEPDRHHVLHGHVRDAHPTALLDTLQQVLDECVHALTQTLEHHERQRDSQNCVEHAECLPRISTRSRMAIAWGKTQQQTSV